MKHHSDRSLAGTGASFGESVCEGLSGTPKTLPCRFFYDRVGSELFEQITGLEEYYPTRTELLILETYIGEIVERVRAPKLTVVEFGSGSSYKTRVILGGLLKVVDRLTYVPIDISAEFVTTTAFQLSQEYPGLALRPIGKEYYAALREMGESDEPRLFLFLGSNIGNFDSQEATEFLRAIRETMGPDDSLLIGADLVKDLGVLHRAYNDQEGVTEQFNKNILARINQELEADFDLDGFNHVASWNAVHQRVEMHLESRWRQRVTIGKLGRTFFFESGETIHTENSHKYTLASLEKLLHNASLSITTSWQDPQEWFTLALARPN